MDLIERFLVEKRHLKIFADALADNLIKIFVKREDGKGLSSNDYTAEDKKKLEGIAKGANNYSLPQAAAGTLGGVKTGYSANGKNYPVLVDTDGNMYVAVPWTDTNTTYGVSTPSIDGLMSAADKKKLDGIAEEANNYTHPASHPASMIEQDSAHRFVSDAKQKEWDAIYAQAVAYADLLIANLINGAPETLDTLGEIAKAMRENADVVTALQEAIGKKANEVELARVAFSGSYDDLEDRPGIPATLKNPNALTFTGGVTGTYDGSVAKTVAIPNTPSDVGAFPTTVRVTTANTDLNDYLNAGIYYFDSAHTPANIPVGVNGWLIVYPGGAGNIVKQIWYRYGTVNGNDHMTYVRMYSGTAWGEWKRFAMADEAILKNTNAIGGNGLPIYMAAGGVPTPIGNILRLTDGITSWSVLQLFDDGDTANNGGNLIVCAGGNIFTGAGESPKNLYNEYEANGASASLPGEAYGKTAERAYFTSDGYMYFLANCQTIGNRRGFMVDTNGDMVPIAPTAGTKRIGTSGNQWKEAYINAIHGNVIGGYGTCSTAAATAAKVVACAGFVLAVGAAVKIKFTVTNTAANPTLNVNSTGAKPIYYRGAAINAGYLASNRTYEFVYNGTQWEVNGDIDTNTTYSAATQSAAGLMSAADKKKLDGVTEGATKNTITFATKAPSTLADGAIVMVYEE